MAQAAERAPVPPPPPAHGDGRRGAAICALTGLTVGALAVVLGAHSTLSERHRTPILAAGIVWSGVSGALLCLIGGAWRGMRRTAKTLVQIIGGILVLAPLAIPVVVVMFASEGAAAVGPVQRDTRSAPRSQATRITLRGAAALLIGAAGYAYGDAVDGRMAGAVGLVVASLAAFGVLAIADHRQSGLRRIARP